MIEGGQKREKGEDLQEKVAPFVFPQFDRRTELVANYPRRWSRARLLYSHEAGGSFISGTEYYSQKF